MLPKVNEKWVDKRDGRVVKVTSVSPYVINGKLGPEFKKWFSIPTDSFIAFFGKRNN